MAFLTEEINTATFTTTGVPPATFDLVTKKFGTSSIVFDDTATSTWWGSGNPVTLNAPTGTNLVGLTNFTISFWVNPTEASSGNDLYVGQHKTDQWPSWYLRKYDNKVWFVAGTSGFLFTSSGYLSTNNWNHIAVVKSGNVYKLFINGITRHTVTKSDADYTGTMGYFSIGAGRDHGFTYHNFDGYIDEFWIKNTAEWSTDFSVPTAPITTPGAEVLFLAHFDEPQFSIFGNASEDCRVLVIDETTWEVENSEVVSAGNYEISVAEGSKTVVAVPDDTGKNNITYRSVTPVTL